MDDLVILDEYPHDAAYGADFFSRNARGEIQVETADGIRMRPEKVLMTPHTVDYEGRVCVGERTIRHWAHNFGLVDEWRFAMVADDNRALRTELVALSNELAAERLKSSQLAQLEMPETTLIYVDVQGEQHASKRAAVEATAMGAGWQPTILDAPATIDPTPRSPQ